MPRKSRIDAPGALHHIIARGIERKVIFQDNRDRGDFLERLVKLRVKPSKFNFCMHEGGASMRK